MNNTETKYDCLRCGNTILDEASNTDYFGYCPACDMDMYKFEVIEQKNNSVDSIKRKALKHLHSKDFIGDMADATGLETNEISFQILEEIFTDAMVEFAFQMCELQKKECAENAMIEVENTDYTIENEGTPIYTSVLENTKIDNLLIYTNKQSILTCNNVCEL